MLEPTVVAAGVGRGRAALRGEVLREFEELVAEAKAGLADVQAEDAVQVLVGIAFGLEFRDFLEREDLRIEVDGAVEIGDGHTDRLDSTGRRESRQQRDCKYGSAH